MRGKETKNKSTTGRRVVRWLWIDKDINYADAEDAVRGFLLLSIKRGRAVVWCLFNLSARVLVRRSPIRVILQYRTRPARRQLLTSSVAAWTCRDNRIARIESSSPSNACSGARWGRQVSVPCECNRDGHIWTACRCGWACASSTSRCNKNSVILQISHTEPTKSEKICNRHKTVTYFNTFTLFKTGHRNENNKNDEFSNAF